MLMLDWRTLSWWFWLVTACFLTAGVSGHQDWQTHGFLLAIGLTLFQLLYFMLRKHSLSVFPVQVRLAYLLLLLFALPASMQWLYWLPAIGTWGLVLFGYCPMARIVSLLPWNRQQALSLRLLQRTFFSAPVRGSFLATRSSQQRS